MFFSTYVLTKKGPLAKIWLAAHWEKKLTRNDVKVIDLTQSIMHIVQPVVPIALRTSGELLVGVVRIYALKVKHLLKDAAEATLYLRVTTTTTTATKADGMMGEGNDSSAKLRHHIDGVLVSSTGKRSSASQQQQQQVGGNPNANSGLDTEAVSFEWRAGVQTGDIAEALDHARFDAISDLLEGGAFHTQPMGTAPHPQQFPMSSADRMRMLAADTNAAAAGAWWYAVEPNSQLTEEQRHTQQDYDDIARVRAELMMMGSGGGAGEGGLLGASSSKKSSLSSVERARASGMLDDAGMMMMMSNGADMDGSAGGRGMAMMMMPAIPDEFDIHMPMTDDGVLPRLSRVGEDGTGFMALPDMLDGDEAAAAAAAATLHTSSTRTRPTANVVDVASTTLSRDAVEKTLRDRSDIVNAEPRRGPMDAQEFMDRFVLSGTVAAPGEGSGNARRTAAAQRTTTPSNTRLTATAQSIASLVEAVPLTNVPNAILRDAFAKLLRRTADDVVAEYLTTSTAASGQRTAAAHPTGDDAGAAVLLPPPMDDDAEYGAYPPASTTAALEGSKKRGRLGEENEGEDDNSEEEEEFFVFDENGVRRASSTLAATAANGLSRTTLAALRRIRATVEYEWLNGDATPNSSGRRGAGAKRLKSEADHIHAWNSTTTTLGQVCSGMSRREAAQTFVGTLALASKSMLTATQNEGWLKDISLQLTNGSHVVPLVAPVPSTNVNNGNVSRGSMHRRRSGEAGRRAHLTASA